MKVTLIMPGVGRKEGEPYINSWKMEPLVLAVLAGLTPSDVEVKLFDDRLEYIPYDEPTDLVAITVETYTAKRAYCISSEFRKRRIPVILGGYHPTLVPDEAIQYADSIVLGEADSVWGEVIEDMRRSKLKKFYRSKKHSQPIEVKPRRELYRNKQYTPITLVESGRGCKFACNFCSISTFYRRTYCWRSVEDVVEEIGSICKKDIFFVDDSITTNLARAKDLFRELIPLKIKWVSQANIAIADDAELLVLMEKSGCVGLLIGFESLNKSNLAQMGKSWNTKMGGYETRLRKIRDHGFKIYATFLFGYDHDTQDTFKKTMEFTLEHKIFLAAFNHLMPFPGTPLYSMLKRENRLLYKRWWLEPDYQFGNIVFRPKQMSTDELTESCVETRQKFYKYSSIFRRFDLRRYHDLSSIGLYLWLNLLLKKEVNKKYGLPLGEGLETGK